MSNFLNSSISFFQDFGGHILYWQEVKINAKSTVKPIAPNPPSPQIKANSLTDRLIVFPGSESV